MRIELTMQTDDPALAPLRQAWRNAGARHAGSHATLAQLARTRHADLVDVSMPSAVREPLALVPSVADLLDDANWHVDAAARENLAGALAYFVEPDDLIPDENLRFGFLDDAFVLKLALAESQHEWLAWCDYREYLAAHPDEAGIDRDTWMQRRRERLDVSLRRRNDPGYSPDGRRDSGYADTRRYSASFGTLARFGVR